MSLVDYQKEVDTWASQFNPSYWPALEQFARLAEETGEVGRELNHLHGTKKKRDETESKLGAELADVIFTAICIANNHNINLDEVWQEMMAKKHYGRDAQRFERK